MSAQRRGGEGGAGPSRSTNPNAASRKPKKKPKSQVQAASTSPAPTQLGPIPQPYLAIAPSPVSSLSRSALNDLAERTSSTKLVLPSSYTRSKSSPNILAELSARASLDATAAAAASSSRRAYAAGLAAPPAIRSTDPSPRSQPIESQPQASNSRRAYADGLIAPPAIRAGASVATARVIGEGSPVAASSGRRRNSEQADGSRERSGGPRRRSEDRLRDVAHLNASTASLGQLGRIAENDAALRHTSAAAGSGQAASPAAPRRRRAAREEAQPVALSTPQQVSRNRRLTVSSREEGRALGVARGASMRRTNLWDDLPDSSDPPPPFPFPTSSSSRLPPTFAATSGAQDQGAPPPSTGTAPQNNEPPDPAITDRTRSPPPTFEQAIGIEPLPSSQPVATTEQRAGEPSSSATRTGDEQGEGENESVPAAPPLRVNTVRGNGPAMEQAEASPASEDYASAPSSPVMTEHSVDAADEGTEEERLDRRMWNADLLAGYSLEERVRREAERRRQRALANSQPQAKRTVLDDPSGVPLMEPEQAASTPRVEQQDPIETSESSDRPEGPAAESSEPTEMTVAEPIVPACAPEAVADLSEHQEESGPVERVTAPPRDIAADVPSGSSNADAVTETVASTRPSQPEVSADKSRGARPTGSPKPSNGSDIALEPSSPARKLTRGKAIRRSSSGMQTLSPSSPRSPRAPQTAQAPAPLFSSSSGRGEPDGSSLVGPGASPTAEPQPQSLDDVARRKRLRRMDSVDTIKQFLSESASPPASPAKLPPHREAALKRRDLATRRADTADAGPSVPAQSPIDDRAGLPRTPSSPLSIKSPSQSYFPALAPVSGPLIDLSESDAVVSARPKTPPFHLTTQELLQLFEQPPVLAEEDDEGEEEQDDSGAASRDGSTVAESSAQAAARAATLAALTAGQTPVKARALSSSGKPASETGSSASTLSAAGAGKKRAPPPPPPVRTRLGEDGLTPKSSLMARRSIIRTATNPVTPRPLGNNTPSPSASRHAGVPQSPTPTRRPPPPPPPPLSAPAGVTDPAIRRVSLYDRPMQSDGEEDGMASAVGSGSAVSSRLSAPRPTSMRTYPPVSQTDKVLPARPTHLRSLSAITSSDTASSLSEQTSHLVPHRSPPLSAGMFRSTSRPRGPRPAPPPPPPRPWAKTIREAMENEYAASMSEAAAAAAAAQPGSRPLSERTRSDNLPARGGRDGTVTPGSPRSTLRSASEADLTSQSRDAAAPRAAPIEYTDLDVLVSRLEGSGREYEGFSQIATFLGPAKPVAASPEALATLLPGPIIVDSRRVTAQGKVKLKLSLLGVRVAKCPICLAQYKQGEIAAMLPECLHSGHETCVRRWFREDSRCPVCRVPLGGRKEEGIV